MSGRSQAPLFPRAISYVGVSPVRTSAPLANGQGSRGSDRASGASSLGSSANSRRRSSSSRTWRAGLRGGCPECGETSGHGVTPRCPFSSPPLRLALVTGAPGSSSWGGRVIAVSDDGMARCSDGSLLPTLLASVKCNYNRRGISPKAGDGLVTALLPTLTAGDHKTSTAYPRGNPTLRGALLPTLTASSATRGRAVRGARAQGGPSLGELLPTLLASDGASPLNTRGAGSQERGGGKRLGDALLPTLLARDSRTGNASDTTHKRPQGRPLSETLGRSARGSGCLLSPLWCELFMGFPRGWTLPSGAGPGGPLPAYEPPASKRSGTPSCPPAPPS